MSVTIAQIQEAIARTREARERMLSIYNMLSPANGDPIVSPSQDIVLGCYYMTVRRPGVEGEGKARQKGFTDCGACEKGPHQQDVPCITDERKNSSNEPRRLHVPG